MWYASGEPLGSWDAQEKSSSLGCNTPTGKSTRESTRHIYGHVGYFCMFFLFFGGVFLDLCPWMQIEVLFFALEEVWREMVWW
jgi:hypothetical protein